MDFRAGELRKQGVRVKLQEQPFQLLQILLEHPGELVTREEFQQRIWPSDTFVDFDQGLNNAVKRLREALEDSSENPHFIETIPRRGYRFVAKLSESLKRIRSRAGLPLENLSRDPDQEYFAEGMTEALITTLAKIGELQVVSRTSVMQYKGVHKPISDIARELGVDAVIEGTVLRAADRVRISAQLIDAPVDRHLWAESYDRDIRDILALQSDVAQAIAREIRIKLTRIDEARLAKSHSVNPEAYDAYLKGRYYWNRRPAEIGKAIEHFKQAIAKDAGHAASYAGLADCLNSCATFDIAPPTESSVKAKQLAEKALEIDNALAEAYAALAYATVFEYDFLTAEREFERAIQLNPRYAPAHHFFGVFLGWMGRYEESYTEMQRALRLDPLPITSAVLGLLYIYGRRYDQAIAQSQKTLELVPNSGVARVCLAWAQSCQSLHESGIVSWREACEHWPGAGPTAFLAQAYAAAGYRDEAQKILEQLQELSKKQYVTPYGIARIYAALGRADDAFEWLETGYQQRANWMILLKVDPGFDSMRSHPRFQNLMLRMNFPPN